MNMEFKSSTNREQPMPKKIETTSKIEFLMGEGAISIYKKEFKDESPERIEKLREIFKTFFKQELENTKVYESKEGATFPYTSINISKFAKELYKEHSKTPLQENSLNPRENQHSKKEFVIGSFLLPVHGNEFTFVEEAMTQAITNLPRALEDLKNGLEPEEIEIYTFGSPTNLLGKMTPEFFDELGKDPMHKLGNLYAELIEQKIYPQEGKNLPKTSVELYGISMGGGMAAIAGEKLLETKKFTQEHQKKNIENRLPYLAIRSEAPVSLSRSKIKKIQIPVAFVLDAIKEIATNSYLRKGIFEGDEFFKQVNAVLAKRGINEDMSPEQKKMKEKSLKSIINSLGNELILNPDLKINEIYGLHDLTSYTFSLARDAKEQNKEHPDTLGSTLVPSQRENSRTFTTQMSHGRPFFKRSSELKRMKKATLALENLEGKE